MKIDVVFTPAEVEAGRLADRAVVVIDVLRATSTIITALANGARAVLPVEGVERAVRTAAEIGRDQALLCGERGGRPIEGFHLGNSPLEFTTEQVEGRTLVMTTTNGTRALLSAAAASRCLVAAFINADAVARAVAQEPDIVLLCAGRAGRFALEDAACAGLIGRRLGGGGRPHVSDAARAAMILSSRLGETPSGFLATTAAALDLASLGFGADVDWCAMLDCHEIVPELRDLRITA